MFSEFVERENRRLWVGEPEMNPASPSAEAQPVLPTEPASVKPAAPAAGPAPKSGPQPPPYIVLTGNPNSGKTTLFNVVGGLTKPSDGQVFVGQLVGDPHYGIPPALAVQHPAGRPPA